MIKLQAKSRLTSADTLTKKQEQLDVNKDGKIDSADLKKLRDGEKPKVEEATTAKSRLLAADGTVKDAAIAIQKIFDKVGLSLKVKAERKDCVNCVGKTSLGKVDFSIHLDKNRRGIGSLEIDWLDAGGLAPGLKTDDLAQTLEEIFYLPEDFSKGETKAVVEIKSEIDKVFNDLKKVSGALEEISLWSVKFAKAMEMIQKMATANK